MFNMKLLMGASAVAVSTILVGCKSDGDSTACADYASLDATGLVDCATCIADQGSETDYASFSTCEAFDDLIAAYEACGASGDGWTTLETALETAKTALGLDCDSE